MRIYKISQNFQMIPQNPTGNVNQDAQLQNLQNSQQALQFMQAAIEAISEVLASISRLDETLGIDTGLRSVIEQRAQQAIAQTPAYDLLSKMGFIADVNMLKDTNKMSQLQVMLQKNIQAYTSGMAAQQQSGTQNALQGMGY